MAARTYGLIASFETTGAIYRAAKEVRDAGFSRWDCITPLPIHGLDKAMGLRRSIVPRVSLSGGITGFCTGMTLIWWADAYHYAIIVGGKPLFSPLFAFPISYELTILFTTFATIIGMFVINGLPMHYHPVLKYRNMRRATDDRFFIVIESSDPRFDPKGTRELLARVGGSEIEELEE